MITQMLASCDVLVLFFVQPAKLQLTPVQLNVDKLLIKIQINSYKHPEHSLRYFNIHMAYSRYG